MSGKLLNSLIAAGALFGAGMVSPNAKAESIPPEKMEQSVKRYDIELSKEESFMANYLYSLIYSVRNDEDTAISEATKISKTLASRLSILKEAKSVYELLKTKVPTFKEISEFKAVDSLTFKIAKLAKRLNENPEELKWEGDKKDSPVYFDYRGKEHKSEKFKISIKFSSDGFDFYVIDGEKQVDNKAMTIARILYSETSSIATEEEVKLICKLILNRIGKKDFGSWNGKRMVACSTPYDVATAKGAFTCVNDPNNSNWNNFSKMIAKNDPIAERDLKYAKSMLSDPDKLNLPSEDDIVYYHDKRVSEERQDAILKKWTNKYWKPVLVKETEHFKFYKVVKNS